MVRKDARALREEAAAATADGKHRRALECYAELERLEPSEPNWPKRVAEIYRRLGKTSDAVAAYDRAIDRYVRTGFLVQAIAVCKVVLQLEPAHTAAQDKLAEISEQQAAGQTSFGALADRHRSLHGIPSVDMLRAAAAADRRRRPSSLPPDEPMHIERSSGDELVLAPASIDIDVDLTTPPPAAPPGSAGRPASRTASGTIGNDDDDFGMPRRRPRRMSSGPVFLSPGAPLSSVPLSAILPGSDPSPRHDGSHSGVMVIPIDEDPIYELSPSEIDDADDTTDLGGYDDDAMTVPLTSAEATGPGASMDIAIEVGPAIDAEPPVLRAPRAPSQSELDEIEDDPVVDASVELDDSALDSHELSVEDLEEAGDGVHGPYSATARQALAATPLFADLPAAALEQLIDRIHLVDLDPGQILFRQGEAGVNLYVVVDGSVRVFNEGPPETELMVLGPGSFFGEIALVTDHPRSATVQAEEPTQLLSIDRDAVRALMRDQPDVLPILLRFVRERLVDSLVRTHPMFAPFGDPDRRYLIGRFRFLEIEPATAFVEQGVRTAGLYVLMAGHADLLRDDVVVGALDSGDMIGETSVLSGSGCPVTAKAGPRCLALFLPRADFQEIIMTHPQVLSYIGDLADERERAWDAVAPESMRVKMV